MDEVFKNASKFSALSWHGKLTKDLSGHKFKAVYVSVSGRHTYSEGKLLGVQPVAKAAEKAQAEATSDLLEARGV